MSRTDIRQLIEIALLATVAYLLDVFTQPLSFGWISYSFKMVPILILSYRWGTKAGLLGGFIWGLLQVVTGQASGGWLNFTQGFLEYFVAFTLIGLAGLVKPQVDKARKNKSTVKLLSFALLGTLLGTTSRYIIHFIAGVIFWGSYAPAGQSAIYYSFTVNGLSWLGETIACVLVIWLLQPFLYKFLETN
ncbi:energy-coupled thiamine transporter ThiT [Streptococcus dentiloxodontae]